MTEGRAIAQRLTELAELREKALISEPEFDRLKANLLDISTTVPAALAGNSKAGGFSGFTLFTVSVALMLPAFAGLTFLSQNWPPLAGATVETLAVLAVASVVGLLLVLFVYLLPAYVSFKRSHPNRVLILVLNLLFGVTLLGWVLLLIWSLRAVHISGTSSGGESGLNVFVNDGEKLSRPTQTADKASVVSELEGLAALKSKGILTDDEYNRLRGDLLARL